MDREAISSPYENLNETSLKAAHGNARLRIISFPLDDLTDFFKEYTQGFKEKITRLKKKDPQPKVIKYWEKISEYNTLKLSRDTTVH